MNDQQITDIVNYLLSIQSDDCWSGRCSSSRPPVVAVPRRPRRRQHR